MGKMVVSLVEQYRLWRKQNVEYINRKINV